MNRKEFLKTLVKGVAVASVVPMAIAHATESNHYFSKELRGKMKSRLEFLKQYPLTPEEAFEFVGNKDKYMEDLLEVEHNGINYAYSKSLDEQATKFRL